MTCINLDLRSWVEPSLEFDVHDRLNSLFASSTKHVLAHKHYLRFSISTYKYHFRD